MKRSFHKIAFSVFTMLALAASAEPTEVFIEQRAVVKTIAELLQTRYVDPSKGQTLSRRLRNEAQSGKWDDTPDPETFAQTLTQHLREISGDGHFAVDYSPQSVSEGSNAAESDYSAEDLERWYGAGVNHGFEEVRRLEGNIGYLKLRAFAPVSIAGDMASAAMTLLAQSDAIIIDLRSNGGGYSEMVHLLAAYLFDRPQAMSGTYNRPSGTTTQASTPAWVPGRRFGGKKPVYILISHRTFSAAEALAYDLQAAKRAIIVGEASGGGAHPFEYRRVGKHFILSLPESRSVNPITGKDWEGSGVIPDVSVAADQALDRAMALAKAAVTAPSFGLRQ